MLAAFSQAGNCSLGKGCSSRWFLPSFLPHGLFQEVVSDSCFFLKAMDVPAWKSRGSKYCEATSKRAQIQQSHKAEQPARCN